MISSQETLEAKVVEDPPSTVGHPIFVGGTGRSGTTIVGRLLNSHADVVIPCHENKLIVEQDGLRSLVNDLASKYDYKGNHYAISRFIEWSQVLRKSGFRNPALNASRLGVNGILKLLFSKSIPATAFCRALPMFDFSLVAIGHRYGLEHYDRCIKSLLEGVIGEEDSRGVVVTEGLLKPVYSPRTSDREELLNYCREFLCELNKPQMLEAGAVRWADDTPSNARYAEFLFELYPAAKVIHMVRDPRDVAASYLEQSWVSKNLDLILSRLKRQYKELIKTDKSVPSESFRTFKLEDFVYNADEQHNQLSNFLELDPDGFDGSISFQASSFGRWKNKFSQEDRQRIERELGDACAHFGY